MIFDNLVLALFAALVLTALIVVGVARSVLPRQDQERTTFPWFWVTFPVTVFAGLVAALRLVPAAPMQSDFGWTMYAPLSDPVDYGFPDLPSTFIWTVILVVGAVASVVAWKRGRV
ncbi:hypothetical protein [Corynebacterium atrinae]|uniref:hypothetical protein n=1 Tax=Corynebacterium atrinae TaxID=1336740 RepID=UPI0025B31EC2|nr:hypothetical protein [Corynebacterium atrinae]